MLEPTVFCIEISMIRYPYILGYVMLRESAKLPGEAREAQQAPVPDASSCF